MVDTSSGTSNDPALGLARLLAARLTHDLGSPLGTLAGMLDLLPGGDGELLAVAKEAADMLRARLRLQAAAWADGAEPSDVEALQGLLRGAPAAQRCRFHFAGPLFAQPVPAAWVPLLLNGALLAAEALPRGGEVHISGSVGDLFFLPEGRQAAWPGEVIAALGGEPAAALATPRRVIAPLLVALAAEQGWTAGLAPAIAGGLPPLVLTRR